jgi:hypothetical protein
LLRAATRVIVAACVSGSAIVRRDMRAVLCVAAPRTRRGGGEVAELVVGAVAHAAIWCAWSMMRQRRAHG